MEKVRRHRRHLEQAKQIEVIKLPDASPQPKMPRVSMEQFAQRMLKIGYKALDFLESHPLQIKMQDVIASQRLLIEKQKLSIHEDALKLCMARFFGGFSQPKEDLQEGEEVNDPKLPKPPGALLPADKE